MAISSEDIQKVREASDIVAIVGERVPLRQRGRDFWCCCPFHNEKTPSCKIDPNTQLWHCFGCGEGGDVFGFVMKADDLSFPDAVRQLAERAHIDIREDGRAGASQSRKARLREVCKETAAFYHAQLMRGKSADSAAARSYLAGRGFGGEVPKKWYLGFAPGRQALVRHLRSKGFKPDEMVEANVAVDRNGRLNDRFYNRVMFPIRDPQGECIAFGGRVIGDGEPKYLNSQETPLFHKSNVLYGLDKAKKSMTATGTAIVVEGYTDVISLHESGIENAVATLGTALTLPHIRLISRHASKRIVYLFDGDAAGQRAADRALGFIDESMTPEAGKTRVELCAVTLPDDLDPADFVAQRGADELRSYVDAAKPLIAYGIERRIAAHDTSSAEGRTRALRDALSVLAPIKSSMLAKDYAVQIAGRLMMREQDVIDMLPALKAPRRADEGQGSYGTGSSAQRGGSQAGSSAQRGSSQANGSGPQGRAGGGRGNAASSRNPGYDGPPPESYEAMAEAYEDGEGMPGEASVGLGGFEEPIRLSEAERSRRRFERRLISLLAQNPLVALARADALAQTDWHDPDNRALADIVLSVLADDPAAKPAQIVSAALEQMPRAAGALTSATAPANMTLEDAVAFLVEELEIGDLETTLASMNAQLKSGDFDSEEERALVFQAVVDLQKSIAAKRAEHAKRIVVA